MKKISWVLLGMAIMAIPVAIAATGAFSDVSEGDYFYSAVQNLKDMKIVKGYGDGTFKPKNNISRAEMAVMMDSMANAMRNACILPKSLFGADIDVIINKTLSRSDTILLDGDFIPMSFSVANKIEKYNIYCLEGRFYSKDGCYDLENGKFYALGELISGEKNGDGQTCEFEEESGFGYVSSHAEGEPSLE